jgi:hypothetical protein
VRLVCQLPQPKKNNLQKNSRKNFGAQEFFVAGTGSSAQRSTQVHPTPSPEPIGVEAPDGGAAGSMPACRQLPGAERPSDDSVQLLDCAGSTVAFTAWTRLAPRTPGSGDRVTDGMRYLDSGPASKRVPSRGHVPIVEHVG